MITLDPELVTAAQEGGRDALEALVRATQRPVFNLAIRMLGHPNDAEDATQEILVKMITHLGDVREPAAAGAWAHKLACRHLVHVRRQGTLEAQRFTFNGFAADLEDGLEELPDTAAEDQETQVLIEEIKVGCTLALLTCLTRPLRAAYILGEIYDLSDAEAAAALEIQPAAFRQRLRRARALVTDFLQARCGIVSDAAACRCDRRASKAQRHGRVQKGRASIPPTARPAPTIAEVRTEVAKLEQERAATALMRSNASFTTDVGRLVLQALRP
ncbi:MAG: RNA polymerase sigma factor [Neomegalonema sp.]|nr:RNA polymerase sigma factor [Neomegalonema sp.]